jgi:hypothetical protein
MFIEIIDDKDKPRLVKLDTIIEILPSDREEYTWVRRSGGLSTLNTKEPFESLRKRLGHFDDLVIIHHGQFASRKSTRPGG